METSKVKAVSCSGQVSRVEAKFAYVATSRLGPVFIPPCSVLPPNCQRPYLTEFLKTGDIVHLIVLPQENKNGCKWVAIKVSLSANNEKYQTADGAIAASSEESRQLVVELISVSSTSAFGVNDEIGNVFIPGSAFADCLSPKLDSFLIPLDKVFCTVRPQALRRGCNWIAACAAKVNTSETRTSIPVKNVAKKASGEEAGIRKGMGTIVQIYPTYVLAVDQLYNEELVYCSILTYTGGDHGLLGCNQLNDIIPLEAVAYYSAKYSVQQKEWIAKDWSMNPPQKICCENSSQTMVMFEQLVVKTFDRQLIERNFPSLMHAAKNEHFLKQLWKD